MTMPVRPMGMGSMNPRPGPPGRPEGGSPSPLLAILASLAQGNRGISGGPTPPAQAMPGAPDAQRMQMLARARMSQGRPGGGGPIGGNVPPGGPAIPPEAPGGGSSLPPGVVGPPGMPFRRPITPGPGPKMGSTEPQNGMPGYMRPTTRPPFVIGNR